MIFTCRPYVLRKGGGGESALWVSSADMLPTIVSKEIHAHGLLVEIGSSPLPHSPQPKQPERPATSNVSSLCLSALYVAVTYVAYATVLLMLVLLLPTVNSFHTRLPIYKFYRNFLIFGVHSTLVKPEKSQGWQMFCFLSYLKKFKCLPLICRQIARAESVPHIFQQLLFWCWSGPLIYFTVQNKSYSWPEKRKKSTFFTHTVLLYLKNFRLLLFYPFIE